MGPRPHVISPEEAENRRKRKNEQRRLLRQRKRQQLEEEQAAAEQELTRLRADRSREVRREKDRIRHQARREKSRKLLLENLTAASPAVTIKEERRSDTHVLPDLPVPPVPCHPPHNFQAVGTPPVHPVLHPATMVRPTSALPQNPPSPLFIAQPATLTRHSAVGTRHPSLGG